MNVGCNVIFPEKNYTVLWLYNNGTCEIKEQNSLGNVKLVSVSEFKALKKHQFFLIRCFLSTYKFSLKR